MTYTHPLMSHKHPEVDMATGLSTIGIVAVVSITNNSFFLVFVFDGVELLAPIHNRFCLQSYFAPREFTKLR